MNIFRKGLAAISILSCCGTGNGYSQVVQPGSANELIKYIKLPGHISKSDMLSGNERIKSELYNYSKTQFSDIPNDPLTSKMDLIIIYTDHDGTPILPDKENQSIQITTSARITANELAYTFNSSAQPWSSSALNVLNTFINDFYPAIKTVTGSPMFNITVNIRKDSTIGFAGLYYPSVNEMVLKGPNDDVFCHESIHAFRDDYVMGLSTYEEGMTRATEVEVYNRLTAYIHPFDEFHSYDYDCFYEALNRPDIASSGGNVFTNPTLVLLKYQIGSYIWAKAFLEDNNFLKRFNDSLYARTVVDPATRYTGASLRNIVETIKPGMEGMLTTMWYDRQFLLNTNPSAGYKLFQRINYYYVDYFYRDMYGNETPQAGATLSWKLFDYNNIQINNGNGISASYGWIGYNPNLPQSYQGKIKVVASVQSPAGPLTDTIYRNGNPNDEHGIFGIVQDVNSGTVTIVALDTAMAPVSGNLVNGAFSFPVFQNARGRFRCDFVYPDCSHYSRIITKDRSKYFLSIRKQSITYWTGLADNSWHNSLNWSAGIVPDQCTDVIINPGTRFNCVISLPAVCRSLKLSGGVVIALNNNLLVKP